MTTKLATAVVVLATGLTTLAGCSGADPATGPSDPPRLGAEGDEPSGPASPSSEPEPSRPAAPGTRVEDSVEVRAGDIEVDGEQERLVADAFVRYTRVRLEAFNRASVDLAELSRVALGDALTQVSSYVAELQQRKRHTVGTIVVGIDGVRIKGADATIETCMLNTSVDVNRRNRVVEVDSPPAYLGTATARQVGSEDWLISDVSIQYADGCA